MAGNVALAMRRCPNGISTYGLKAFAKEMSTLSSVYAAQIWQFFYLTVDMCWLGHIV